MDITYMILLKFQTEILKYHFIKHYRQKTRILGNFLRFLFKIFRLKINVTIAKFYHVPMHYCIFVYNGKYEIMMYTI